MRRALPFLICVATILGATPSAHAEHMVRSSGAPAGLVTKLDEYLGLGKRLDAVAVDPAGRWVVVAENYRYYSHTTNFNNNGLRGAIEDARTKGRRIRAVEFDEDGDWLLIGDGLLQTNDQVEFNRRGLMSSLKAHLSAGRTITAFGRDRKSGAYAFVANGVHYASGLAGPARAAFGDARLAERLVTDLAFDGGRFIVATYGRTVGTALGRQITWIREENLDVEKAILIGTYGYLLAASDRRPALSEAQADADRFERNFNNRVTGSVGAHIESAMAAASVPGAVVARWKDGRVLWTRGYGVMEAQTERFTRSDTIFPAASMSKVVAGMLGARLHEAGLIDLDQPLVELVGGPNDGAFSRWWHDVVDPWWLDLWGMSGTARDWRERSGRLTARMLLQHIGGLNVHGIGLFPADDQPTLDDILLGEGEFTTPVQFQRDPGTAWDYSGGGYSVFEAMIEEVVYPDFPALAQGWVLGPAGTSTATTGFAPPSNEDNAAVGTNDDGTSRGDLEDCPGEAAGGLSTTAGEYIRVVAAIRNAARGDYASPFSNAEARHVLGRALVFPDPDNITFCTQNATCAPSGTTCQVSADRLFRVCANVPVNVDASPIAPREYGLGANLGITLGAARLPTDFSHGGSQAGYRNTFRMKVVGNADGFVIFTNGPDCDGDDSPCTGGGSALRSAADAAMQAIWTTP
jgi:CubicO group peptidase (beta-lactamase class C family)